MFAVAYIETPERQHLLDTIETKPEFLKLFAHLWMAYAAPALAIGALGRGIF